MVIQLTEMIEKYGAIIIFFPVFLGRIGLPVPAFPALIIAAALASGNAASVAAVIVAGIGAGLLADFSWFIASRRHSSLRSSRNMASLSAIS
jgi:membrane protein DedA with SNARE-associated domain